MDQARYREKYLEKKFLESESFMKLFFYLCPLLYLSFWVADYLKYPEKAEEFLIVRLIVSGSLIVSYPAYTLKKTFYKNQILTTLWTTICSSGIAYMLYHSSQPLSFYYLIGFTLVSLFSLVFGVFDKIGFYLTLFLSYVPYIVICILNHKYYFENWKEFAIFNIINAGFIFLTISVNIKKNHDFNGIIKAELKLENEIINREKIIEANNLEISTLKNNEIDFLKKSFQFDLAQKVSHDIRSPLSTLNIISNKIENSDLRQIHNNVIEQINNISYDLLNYSKIQNSILNKKEMFEVISFIKIFNLLDIEYKAKKELHNRLINFVIDIKKLENHTLRTDMATSLYSIINNLIQNSIEATSDVGGIITIEASADKDNYIIIVSDNGLGMTNDIIEKLGKVAFSYGKADSKLHSGNGIAIYRAFEFINKNNGVLNIESSVNIGTTIKISLPKK